MQRQVNLGLVAFRDDHTEPPFRKAHLRPIAGEDDTASDEGEVEGDLELANQVRGSYFYKQSQVAVRHLRDLMGEKVFNNPKDHSELSRLFEYVLDHSDGIVMDFFAGSGSTAEAVFELGSRNGQNCPVILVQLPENLEDNLANATGAARTTTSNAINHLQRLGKPTLISELTKLRIRAAGERLTGTSKIHPGWGGDVGFRTLRIDSTNMIDVRRTPEGTEQQSISGLEDSLKSDRSAEDLLFQVLVDWGLELTMPIDTHTLAGHDVFVVDDEVLVACFDARIGAELVEAVAKLHPLRAVFRDDAFASDDARINAEQVFREISPFTEVKVI